MRKKPLEQRQRYMTFIGDIGATIGAGATIEISHLPYRLAPTLWVDFLNAEPKKSNSMWLIYKQFARSIEDLKDWIEKEGHSLDTNDMKLLTKAEFLEQYPEKLQEDAERFHLSMMEIIDKKKNDIEIEKSLSNDIHMPSPFYKITATNQNNHVAELIDLPHELSFPDAEHPNFWLTIIQGGMLLNYREGTIAHRCAAPDCQKYFIPSSRSHGQKYHSPTCQNRHYMNKRNKSL